MEGFLPELVKCAALNPAIPHICRKHRHFPEVGFVTWDEATILYNYGRTLRDGHFLEVGCWVGWSTLVLALSGLRLTTVDPVLNGLPQGEACRSLLRESKMDAAVKLIGGYSPEAVRKEGEGGMRWDGFFIDGNHEGDAPALDAMECARFASDNCVILFHDLVQPNIASALSSLREKGWKCGLHYTSQMMGVAWRGNIMPLNHTPDPKVPWEFLMSSSLKHLHAFARL